MLSNDLVIAEMTYSPMIRRYLTFNFNQQEGDARTDNDSPRSSPTLHSSIHSHAAMQTSNALPYSRKGELGLPWGYQVQDVNDREI